MGSLFTVSKSAFLGFELYQSYRNSRVFLAGWEEQKTLCTTDHIANIALLAIAATDNVTAVFGQAFSSRLIQLSYASYILVPALHYLSDSLEESDCQNVKKILDFTYLHLTDLVLVATAIHSVAALRFGYNVIGNGIQLSFILLSILEQGTFWMDPKQNQGPLITAKGGEIYRAYEPLFTNLFYYLGIPLQFFFKGLMGKVIALSTLFLRYASTNWKAVCIPEETKNLFESVMERELEKSVHLEPKGELFPDIWVLEKPGFEKDLEEDLEWAAQQKENGMSIPEIREGVVKRVNRTLHAHFTLTERHLELVSVEDFFKTRNLEDLVEELKKKLEEDTSLSAENREMLEKCLGKPGEKGLLQGVVESSANETLKKERRVVCKGVLGAIVQDWDRRKIHLIERYREFLCDNATAEAMKNLYFELYPSLKYPSEGFNDVTEAQKLGVRLQSKVALIFQQYRDHGFAAGIQNWSAHLKERVIRPAVIQLKEHEKVLYEKVKDLSQISTKLWWKNLFKYALKTVQGVLWQNFFHFLHHMGTNRHEVNLHMALYGKELGLSDYQEARDDIEKLLKQFSLNMEILNEMSLHLSEFFKIQVLRLHDQIWYANLLEAILESGDERLRADRVLTYMHYRSESFPDVQNRVQKEIGDYFASPDDEELKILVAQYLPQLLVDLDFLRCSDSRYASMVAPVRQDEVQTPTR